MAKKSVDAKKVSRKKVGKDSIARGVKSKVSLDASFSFECTLFRDVNTSSTLTMKFTLRPALDKVTLTWKNGATWVSSSVVRKYAVTSTNEAFYEVGFKCTNSGTRDVGSLDYVNVTINNSTEAEQSGEPLLIIP